MFQLLKLFFGSKSKTNKSIQNIPVIETDKTIVSKLSFDWDKRFPISGDDAACDRFRELINASMFSGIRVENSPDELLELVASSKVRLNAIIEFQKRAEGKYKIVKRKAIITDESFDERPYGTLSSLLKNDPKTCLRSYRVAITNYMMDKYNTARHLASGIGIVEGKIHISQNASRRCAKDKGIIFKLDPENLPVPHYLGCHCTIQPILNFKK